MSFQQIGLDAFPITPNDSTDLATPTKGIYVGVAGNLKVTQASQTVTYTNLVAGMIHPIHATRVFDTGTTATGIIGVI